MVKTSSKVVYDAWELWKFNDNVLKMKYRYEDDEEEKGWSEWRNSCAHFSW